jgi:hypothetical protein
MIYHIFCLRHFFSWFLEDIQPSHEIPESFLHQISRSGGASEMVALESPQ